MNLGHNIAMHMDSMARHELTLCVDADTMQHWRMGEPKTGNWAVHIAFVAGHIVITGDACPGRYGVVSCGGYGLKWFTNPLSPDYLAEKFLSKGWHHELAADELRRMADGPWTDEEYPPEHVAEFRRLAGLLDAKEIGVYELRDRLDDLETRRYTDDDVPGWGYDPRDHAILAAIQRKFRELHAAREWEVTL